MKSKRRSTAAKASAPPKAPRAKSAPTSSFPIVGIGASAGGLEAFRRLLGALPTDIGMAYVLVQHLDPHHESILDELLSGRRRCRSPRSRATCVWNPTAST
jgi:two-component system CheB/CheR fusion protein